MVFNQTRTLKVRFERHDSTEPRPCYYIDFVVSDDELIVMVERDYRLRLADADDPGSVRRRDALEILIEELNKPEYNQVKRYHRNTTYRASTLSEDA